MSQLIRLKIHPLKRSNNSKEINLKLRRSPGTRLESAMASWKNNTASSVRPTLRCILLTWRHKRTVPETSCQTFALRYFESDRASSGEILHFQEPKSKEKPKIVIDNRIASQIRKEALQKELAEKVSANKPRRKTMPVTKKPSNKRVP